MLARIHSRTRVTLKTVTCDGPLGATPGHAARIDVIR
jgi:hypothetical protein